MLMFASDKQAEISRNRMIKSLEWGLFPLVIPFFELLFPERKGSLVRPNLGFSVVSLKLEILLVTPMAGRHFHTY